MKRYYPQSEKTRRKHLLPAWAVTPTFILGVVIVVIALIMAIFPAQIAPYDPTVVDITARTKAPSAASGIAMPHIHTAPRTSLARTTTAGTSSLGWCGAPASTCPSGSSACWCR